MINLDKTTQHPHLHHYHRHHQSSADNKHTRVLFMCVYDFFQSVPVHGV